VTEAAASAGHSGLTCCALQQAIAQALNAAEQKGIQFAQFDQDKDGMIDMITVLHSGYGAEWGGATYTSRIWYASTNSRLLLHAFGHLKKHLKANVAAPYLHRSHKWCLPAPYVSRDGVKVLEYHIEPAMWGTTGTNTGHIGVIAHETGHFLGTSLPTLDRFVHLVLSLVVLSQLHCFVRRLA
jgi:M6 family metalloprotease-like protein